MEILEIILILVFVSFYGYLSWSGWKFTQTGERHMLFNKFFPNLITLVITIASLFSCLFLFNIFVAVGVVAVAGRTLAPYFIASVSKLYEDITSIHVSYINEGKVIAKIEKLIADGQNRAAIDYLQTLESKHPKNEMLKHKLIELFDKMGKEKSSTIMRSRLSFLTNDTELIKKLIAKVHPMEPAIATKMQQDLHKKLLENED